MAREGAPGTHAERVELDPQARERGAVKPLPPHAHDKSSPRGSCGICYAWCLLALPIAFANPSVNVVQPRHFDRTNRTWTDAGSQTGPRSQIPCDKSLLTKPSRASEARALGPSIGSVRDPQVGSFRLGDQTPGGR